MNFSRLLLFTYKYFEQL